MLLKRKKQKHKLPAADINIVSLMDILTVLLFFLLVIATVSELYVIPASALTNAATKTEEKKPAFALQLIIVEPKVAYVYLGAVEQLRRNNPEGLRDYLSKRFSGNEQSGYFRKLEASSKSDLLNKLQDILVILKKHFPNETRSVVAFTDAIDYQLMVDAMSRIREVGAHQQPVAVQSNKLTEVLFPQITVSEWSTNAGST